MTMQMTPTSSWSLSIGSRHIPRDRRLAVLCLATLAAAGVGVAAGAYGRATQPLAQTVAMEPTLAMLLRFMAIVKAASVGAMLLASAWRFRRPTSPSLTLAYVSATGLAALAPGLIWSLNHVVAGAALFHAGLFIMVVAGLRDGMVRLPSRH